MLWIWISRIASRLMCVNIIVSIIVCLISLKRLHFVNIFHRKILCNYYFYISFCLWTWDLFKVRHFFHFCVWNNNTLAVKEKTREREKTVCIFTGKNNGLFAISCARYCFVLLKFILFEVSLKFKTSFWFFEEALFNSVKSEIYYNFHIFCTIFFSTFSFYSKSYIDIQCIFKR